MKQQFSDKEIIAGVKADDEPLLKSWYQRDFPYIKNFILKNNGTENDAKEIYQDAFMVVYQKIMDGQFKSTAAIKTFLFAIARNLWFKNLRDNNKLGITEDVEQLQIADIGDTYDWEVDEQEKQVMAQIAQLGLGCQKILELYYFGKKSLKTIAEEMGYKSEKNARNAKYKCMQQLRNFFKA